MSSYAAAKSVLADDEMTLGATLVEMGGATTGFAIFHDGHLVTSDIIPIGGMHITNDIARGLSTTIAHAERMKTLWGSALASQVDEREMIAVPLLGERGVDTVQKVPKSMLTGIIRPRLEEIFELLRDKIEASGVAHLAGRRAVLTGGASQLNGNARSRGPVAGQAGPHGRARPYPGHAGSQPIRRALRSAPDSCIYALRPDTHYALPKAKAEEIENAQQGYVRRMGRWIAESF